MNITDIGATLSRLTGKQEERRVSIEDWIGSYADRREVQFCTTHDCYLAENQGKQWKCKVIQSSHGFISVEAYGHTTAEAFWDAIAKFHKVTGGIYRSGK